MPKGSVQARTRGSDNGNGIGATFDSPAMGIMNPFTFFTINMAGYNDTGIPAWSYYPQVRDQWLRILSKHEPIMASALYSMTSRIKSLRWNIATGGPRDKKYYQSLFAEAEGGLGYGEFISKVVTDLLTQDNGAFIELVGGGREDRPLIGRVKELWHMDSGQCWRTFDPEYPVIYIDPLDNSYHRMHHTRVIRIASYPQPDERARGIGFCAASRALKLMQTMRAIQVYREEKITGKFNRGLIYGNGLTVKQFEEATEKSEQVAASLNYTIYKDIPVLLSMMPDMKLDVLDLASLPDGFDYEKEITLYVYCLALAFGTDAREFWPATASGATKADATVQHLKAQGKGTADIIKSFESAFGWQIMPSNGKAAFEYDFTDDEQDKAVAELQKIKAENIAILQANGWIDPFEGRALAIGAGLIDTKALQNAVAPEPADDTGPIDIDDETVLPLDSGGMLEPGVDPLETDEEDSADSGGRADPQYGKFTWDETKHPRKGGKFTSKSGSDSTSGKPTLSTRLRDFLGFLNRTGSYKNGVFTVNGATRDRSKDLETFLHTKGYKDVKVIATKTAAGMEYRFEGLPDEKKTRKPRKRRTRKKKLTAIKAKAYPAVIARKDMTLEQYIAQYESALNDLYDDFIAGVVEFPGSLDEALDDLYDEFLNNMPTFLTTGFGVGLQGADPTEPGINRLEQIGQTSATFFADSFMIALAALGIADQDSAGIRESLETLRARFLMYAGAMWNAIWAGLFDSTPADRKVRRVMEPGAEHCPTCPGKERVYNSFQEMVDEVGLPGDGSDDCLTNCRCTIEIETEPGSGVYSSALGDPTVFVTPLFEVLRGKKRYGRAA